VGLGNLFLEAGDLAQALAKFDAALALRPASDEALVGRALALARQGRHCDAVSAFDAALGLNRVRGRRATLDKSRVECARRKP
jgi:Tfp pilus assembly protein PilF